MNLYRRYAYCFIVCGALLTMSVRADIISATLKFTRLQDVVTRADQAMRNGDRDQALAFYKVALNGYTEIMAEDPDFQPNIIEHRMLYVDDCMDALFNQLATVGDADSTTNIVTETTPRPAMTAPRRVAPAAAASTPQKGDVAALLAQARHHLEIGEPETARARIIEGFKIDPDNVSLRLLAGLAQCQDRRFGDAIFLLKELSVEEPNNAEVHVGLAAAYLGDGQREAARAELEAAIAANPRLAEAYYNLAQLELSNPQPDREAARASYARACELGAAPDPRLEAALQTAAEAGPQ